MMKEIPPPTSEPTAPVVAPETASKPKGTRKFKPKPQVAKASGKAPPPPVEKPAPQKKKNPESLSSSSQGNAFDPILNEIRMFPCDLTYTKKIIDQFMEMTLPQLKKYGFDHSNKHSIGNYLLSCLYLFNYVTNYDYINMARLRDGFPLLPEVTEIVRNAVNLKFPRYFRDIFREIIRPMKNDFEVWIPELPIPTRDFVSQFRIDLKVPGAFHALFNGPHHGEGLELVPVLAESPLIESYCCYSIAENKVVSKSMIAEYRHEAMSVLKYAPFLSSPQQVTRLRNETFVSMWLWLAPNSTENLSKDDSSSKKIYAHPHSGQAKQASTPHKSPSASVSHYEQGTPPESDVIPDPSTHSPASSVDPSLVQNYTDQQLPVPIPILDKISAYYGQSSQDKRSVKVEINGSKLFARPAFEGFYIANFTVRFPQTASSHTPPASPRVIAINYGTWSLNNSNT